MVVQEEALLFPTGFAANVAVMSSLAQASRPQPLSTKLAAQKMHRQAPSLHLQPRALNAELISKPMNPNLNQHPVNPRALGAAQRRGGAECVRGSSVRGSSVRPAVDALCGGKLRYHHLNPPSHRVALLASSTDLPRIKCMWDCCGHAASVCAVLRRYALWLCLFGVCLYTSEIVFIPTSGSEWRVIGRAGTEPKTLNPTSIASTQICFYYHKRFLLRS